METDKSFFRNVNYSVLDMLDYFVDRTMTDGSNTCLNAPVTLAQIATSAFVTQNQHYL